MNHPDQSGRYCFAGLLLCICIIICYSNTLYVDWQFDDFQNVLVNPRIQVLDFSYNQLKNVFYAAPDTDQLSRPFTYLTFAVNWFFARDNVVWYHVVNIGIHCLSALFLLIFLLKILHSPKVFRAYNRDEKYFIVLFSVFLWAVNPIQTQSVTYIVQRMAELAGMFYVLSMLCYVSGRQTGRSIGRLFYFSLCGLFYVLAFFSKQNGATLPVALLLIEFLFFQDMAKKSVRNIACVVILGSGLVIGGLGFYYFLGNDIPGLLRGYQIRPYTLFQRMLTESRIVIFYLSQIFYPVPTRLSIVHMYPISTSIVDPWTTILCLSAIVTMACTALYAAIRAPFLSFAILFYFLNNLVESTIIPLELVYEHRNYLPSMFLFVPVSIGFLHMFKYYEVHNRMMHRFLIVSITLLLIGLGMSTYVRNMAWRTQKTMWEDVLGKAPDSPRPYHNLAWGYYQRKGAYDQAIVYYEKAAALPHINLPNTAQPYYCIGNLYDLKENVDSALRYYGKALDICPDYALARYKTARDLLIKEEFTEAEKLIDPLLASDPENVSYIWLKGVLCIDQHRLDQALAVFRRCMALQSGGWKNYFYVGVIFNLKMNFDKGYWFLRRADALQPENAMILLSLALNRFSMGKKMESAQYADKFIDIVKPDAVQGFFDKLAINGYHIPFGFEKLKPLLSEELIKRGDRIVTAGNGLSIQPLPSAVRLK